MLQFLKRAEDFQKKNTGPEADQQTGEGEKKRGLFGLPSKFFIESVRPKGGGDKRIATNEERQRQRRIEEEMLRWTAVVGRYTQILAFIGAVGLFIAGLQWHELDKAYEPAERSSKAAVVSANVAKETLVSTQRPYYTVSNIEVGDAIDAATESMSEWGVKAVFENSGQTPAFDTSIYARIDPIKDVSWKFETNFPENIGIEPKADVGPRGKIATAPKFILDSQITEILKGEDLRFYGELIYKTAFKELGFRTKEFCFQIVVERAAQHKSGSNPFGWKPCNDHNTQN